MRKIFLALMLVSGLAAAAHAGDWSTDGPPLPRVARLQNLMAPPADSMYSLGGYAPADPNMNAMANPNLIDKSEVNSPTGCCGGLWDGYVARPCHHQHHFGWGGCGCGQGNNGWGHSRGGWGGGCNTGCCSGGMGLGGYGVGYVGYMGAGGGCGCDSPSCAPVCRPRHHCPLFGCHKRSNCCGDVADSCGCGCGATDSTQPTPSGDNAPRPEALEPEATPAPAPAPTPTSAQRQPRLLKSMAALGGLWGN
jgi:hypothetical protein